MGAGRFRRVASLILLSTAGMMAGSCGVMLVPEPGQGGRVDVASRMVTKEARGLQVTVQSMAWQYDPYYLDDFFTPLLVFVRNMTEEPIALRHQDFVLVDDRGNQFDAVPPQTVDRAIRGRGYPYPYPPPFYYPPRPGIGPYAIEPYPYHYADIILLGLAETSVLPHAQVRGFVYFQKATFEGQRLTLTASIAGRSQEFHFSIQR